MCGYGFVELGGGLPWQPWDSMPGGGREGAAGCGVRGAMRCGSKGGERKEIEMAVDG
ncbi:hypothetical protein Acr_02g0007310 [Actinidia rufa]|uniref:Uncharacterized protein n=1 Tax=Actinidia rufa TaxID=165716 RepID=A0A7J0E7N1_9ERIC|nr:hypothetical protein Acr_02g0007310 [Actinidia rufa]